MQHLEDWVGRCPAHRERYTNYCTCEALLCPECINPHVQTHLKASSYHILTIKKTLLQYFERVAALKGRLTSDPREADRKLIQHVLQAKDQVLSKVEVYFQNLLTKVLMPASNKGPIESLLAAELAHHQSLFQSQKVLQVLFYNWQNAQNLMKRSQQASPQLRTNYSVLAQIQQLLGHFIFFVEKVNNKDQLFNIQAPKRTLSQCLEEAKVGPIASCFWYDSSREAFTMVKTGSKEQVWLRGGMKVPQYHRLTPISNTACLMTGGVFADTSPVTYSKECYLLDFAEGKSSRLADLLCARSSHGHCLFQESVVVVGGSTDSGKTNSAEIYSLAERKWHPLSRMNIAVSQATLVCMGPESILRVGGRLNSNNLDNSFQLYDQKRRSWKIVVFAFAASESRAAAASFRVFAGSGAVGVGEDKVLVFGGYNEYQQQQGQVYTLRRQAQFFRVEDIVVGEPIGVLSGQLALPRRGQLVALADMTPLSRELRRLRLNRYGMPSWKALCLQVGP